MYNIVISKNIIEKIDNFIEKYLDWFLSLIEDSWIDKIEIIEENYIKISIEFKEKILFSVKNNFCNEIIQKKIEVNDNFSSMFEVWSFRFFVKFSENEIDKIRFLNEINIYKK
jgi:hypothetical protein